MESSDGRIARLKHDRYTGENRCLPCAVMNRRLVFLLAVGIQAAAIGLDAPVLAVPGSAAVLAVALATIYVRG